LKVSEKTKTLKIDKPYIKSDLNTPVSDILPTKFDCRKINPKPTEDIDLKLSSIFIDAQIHLNMKNNKP
jgi:hypothetical protein